MSEDRTEWLDWRRRGIGGSDIAILQGLSHYDSPYGLWLDKTGRREHQKEATSAMNWGNIMEPVLEEQFTKRTGLFTYGSQTRMEHPEHIWPRATLDALVTDRVVEPLGVLELKTSGRPLSDMMPVYVAQVQWQMFVTGLPKAWIAVLRNGNDFTIHEVEEDLLYQNEQFALAQRFWNDHVLADVPPEIDGSEQTRDALNDSFRPAKGLTTEIEPDIFQRLIDARAALKAAEIEKEWCENTIKARMADAEAGQIDGKTVVTWVPRISESLDTKALKEQDAAVAAKYATKTVSRVFTVTRGAGK